MLSSVETKACVIIPARYESSRFPGKPLVPLLGKPMILWVAELCAKAVNQANVFVATESNAIAQCVSSAGFTALMTSSEALTGTDRVAEAAEKLDYDIYVNVQGDEPMVNPIDISRCIELKKSNPSAIVNGYTWLSQSEDVQSVNIPKVIANERDRLIYMSRGPLPAYKESRNKPKRYKKQVCIYAFSRAELSDFRRFGRKSELECAEDIEILRFLELNREILMFECSAGSLAVDIPEDVIGVEKALEGRSGSSAV
jgi:3-deoxy-manno-octulosonate cytidylyltransferase (CMP-KDO synthetase)